MEFEAVIGLEVHVQIKTETKMFTSCPYNYGADENTLTDPVVLALPGTLPVMNGKAVLQAAKTGLIFNCRIADVCKWDRKNYFYPDCPKNYQISQNFEPLCIGGEVEIELEGQSRNIMGKHRKVKLNRIHLEEDVGKLTHGCNDSLVDFNRAGVPLIEIVSEPDMFSAEEAFSYLNSLKTHLQYAGISECDMEKGQMRCDANVSVRPVGQKELGTKVEIKNLNSISGVKNGIDYEIARQTKAIQAGETIIQETRRWDAEKMITLSMRTKETANDYRYFPDPDLMPVKLDSSVVQSLADSLPEMPFEKQERFFKQYDLPFTITSVFYPNADLCTFFEEAVKLHNNPKAIANFIANDLLRELSNNNLSIKDCKITTKSLADLVKLIDDGVISKQIAQDVFIKMFESGKTANELVSALGLKQNSNIDELIIFCKQAISENPKAVAEFMSGKEAAINAIKGNVMKLTKGKANTAIIDKTLRELLINK